MLLCLIPSDSRLSNFCLSAAYLISTPTLLPLLSSTTEESMSTSSSDNSPSLARSRWGLLQQAIIKKTIPEPIENPASKRVFERYSKIVNWTSDVQKAMMNVKINVPFGRFLKRKPEKEQMASFVEDYGCEEEPVAISKLSSPKNATDKGFDYCTAVYTIQLFRRNTNLPVNIKNLKGFDKTGRICIWPSEQILTYWSLRNLALFEGKKVIEIGGGFHCLAGLALAKYSAADQVVLTDGDAVNVDDVSYTIQRNNILTDNCHAISLRWGAAGIEPELKFHFDIIIAADVVYEVGTFTSLLETIWLLLKPGGQFILFNPTRDGMLAKFVALTRQRDNSFGLLEVKWIEHYDPLIDDHAYDLSQVNPAFNKDWHYPNQVILKKPAYMTGFEEQVSDVGVGGDGDWFIKNSK